MEKIGWCETYLHLFYHHKYKTRRSDMITWMMGDKRAGTRLRSTSPNTINNLSNIEQGKVVDIFRPNYMSCNTTPTISSMGVRVTGIGTIYNSPITTNSISWKSQQSTTFNLVMGRLVAGLIHIYISPFNINSCYPIAKVRVAGLLWPRSTSINTS